jgi:DNA-binding NarL/FixJ family response regulator
MLREIIVFIVDDHPLVRTGVHATFESKSGFPVLWEAESGSAALIPIERYQPDVLILDLEMSGDPPPVTISKCRKAAPGMKFLILSGHTESHYLPARGDIDGFVQKKRSTGVPGPGHPRVGLRRDLV